MRYLIILFIAISLSGCDESTAQIQAIVSTASQGQPVEYFLRIRGQSNGEGITEVADLDVNLQREFQNVYIWYNETETDNGGEWQKLQAGVNNNRSTRLIYYGSEIAIADLFETNHPNDVLYISKYAVGSASVATQAGSDWNASSSGEALDIANQYYDEDALAALAEHDLVDLGLIWMQGEQDAAHATNSATATFRTNTLNMLSEFRTAAGDANLTVYICRLNAAIDRDAGQLANVRTAQGTSSGNLTDTATNPNNVFVDTDAYSLIDTVHFEQLPFGEDLYDLIFGSL
jgi:hypothetical protein